MLEKRTEELPMILLFLRQPVRIGSKTNHRIVREVNAAIYRDDALEARRPAFGHVGELVDAIMLIFMPTG
jgi:hypothetical protein